MDNPISIDIKINIDIYIYICVSGVAGCVMI